MYAIVETGGKQYKVAVGDVISVEKLDVNVGDSYKLDNVLAVIEGDDAKFGAPYIKGISVSASVVENGKGKKVIVYKYKSKKTFHKKNGHRQPFTKLKIDSIDAGKSTAKKAK